MLAARPTRDAAGRFGVCGRTEPIAGSRSLRSRTPRSPPDQPMNDLPQRVGSASLRLNPRRPFGPPSSLVVCNGLEDNGSARGVLPPMRGTAAWSATGLRNPSSCHTSNFSGDSDAAFYALHPRCLTAIASRCLGLRRRDFVARPGQPRSGARASRAFLLQRHRTMRGLPPVPDPREQHPRFGSSSSGRGGSPLDGCEPRVANGNRGSPPTRAM